MEMLKEYFGNSPDSIEIVSDIEDRMNELFQLRLSGTDQIVSESDAQEVINIIGNPKDFGIGKQGLQSEEQTGSGRLFNPKKKLYRDKSQAVLGGVCSGLGHYLRVDPVVVRIIYLILFFIFGYFGSKFGFSVVLSYLALWVIVPQAKTFSQKIDMKGIDVSENGYSKQSDYKGYWLKDMFQVLFKVIMICIIISTCITLISIISGLLWLNFDTRIIGINDYLFLLGKDTRSFKMIVASILLLPSIGILVFLIRIVKQARFNRRVVSGFIIVLIFWISAIAYMVRQSWSVERTFQSQLEAVDTIPMHTDSKTLVLKLGEGYLNAAQQPISDAILSMHSDENTPNLCILPTIEIQRDSLIKDFKIEIQKKVFGKSPTEIQKVLEYSTLPYSLSDSVLSLQPSSYTKSNRWQNQFYKIVVKAPIGKQVVVSPPLNTAYRINLIKGNAFRYEAIFRELHNINHTSEFAE